MNFAEIIKLTPRNVVPFRPTEDGGYYWPTLHHFFDDHQVDEVLDEYPQVAISLTERGVEAREYWYDNEHTDWDDGMVLNILFQRGKPVVAEAHYEHGSERWVFNERLYRELYDLFRVCYRVDDVVSLEEAKIDGLFGLDFSVKDDALKSAAHVWTKEDVLNWINSFDTDFLKEKTAAEIVGIVNSCFRETDYRHAMLNEDDVRHLSREAAPSELDAAFAAIPVVETVTIVEYATKGDAMEAMEAQVDDPCVDNYRFAYVDDAEAVAAYEAARDNGCCGAYDATVMVAGRRAYIGCNYGH